MTSRGKTVGHRRRRGVASVEFAIIVPTMLATGLALLDILHAFNAKLQLMNAVSSTASYAFTAGQSLTTSGSAVAISASVLPYLTNLARIAQGSTSLQLASLTITFNGAIDASAAGSYYCPTGVTTPWSFGSALATNTTTCASPAEPANVSGTTVYPGKYVTIAATYTLRPYGPVYFGSAILFGSTQTLSDSAIVRLQ